MRRKLWLLLILSLFLVVESCCASSASARIEELAQALQEEEQQSGGNSVLNSILTVCLTSLVYWYFDLHQKEEGWYTCKFYYAGGYRTKLFYNRIYLDFYYSLFKIGALFFFVNINVRIYRDFYFVFPIPVLPILISVVTLIAFSLRK